MSGGLLPMLGLRPQTEDKEGSAHVAGTGGEAGPRPSDDLPPVQRDVDVARDGVSPEVLALLRERLSGSDLESAKEWVTLVAPGTQVQMAQAVLQHYNEEQRVISKSEWDRMPTGGEAEGEPILADGQLVGEPEQIGGDLADHEDGAGRVEDATGTDRTGTDGRNAS